MDGRVGGLRLDTAKSGMCVDRCSEINDSEGIIVLAPSRPRRHCLHTTIRRSLREPLGCGRVLVPSSPATLSYSCSIKSHAILEKLRKRVEGKLDSKSTSVHRRTRMRY